MKLWSFLFTNTRVAPALQSARVAAPNKAWAKIALDQHIRCGLLNDPTVIIQYCGEEPVNIGVTRLVGRDGIVTMNPGGTL